METNNTIIKRKKFSKEEMDILTKDIDTKLEEFIKSGKYKEILMTMSNLSHYSLNNQIYILMQKPDAKTVYGIKKWNKLGRHVIKNEKSLRIFKPIVVKEDDNTEEKYICKGFQAGYVFDISQTIGKEFNIFKFDENKIVKHKNIILNSLKKTMLDNGYTISYTTKDELGDNCYGLCNHRTKEIKILENLSDLQEVSTTVHECGHALAHSIAREDFKGLTVEEKREIKEVEAESIACIVCTYLSLDTQNFNFSYITSWSNGDISKFRNNLNIISKYANILIQNIENELENIEQFFT